MIENENVLIIGGTGTLGRELIAQLYDKNQITVFSRDEMKQQELKRKYPLLKCIIGDIRNYDSVHAACRPVKIVFHVAAMKHIDVVEANAEEAVMTNIIGSLNVAKAATAQHVSNVVFSSTDKAVNPINIYGFTKGLIERHYLNLNKRNSADTKFSVFRWGNVLGSRGSAIHSFIETLEKERKIYLTEPEMTRFWIHIQDAVKFMIDNYKNYEEVNIPPMKAACIARVADTIANLKEIGAYKVVETGRRHGEKTHETICRFNLWHDAENLRSDDAQLQLTDRELEAMLRGVV